MDPIETEDPRNVALGVASAALSAALMHQRLDGDEAAKFLTSVHAAALAVVTGVVTVAEPEPEPIQQPTAAQIKKSIQQDGLTSFIDGKSYKTLKRHLTSNGLTPETYRERYGLPADYPMTAPAYSAARSALAKSLGLGNGGRPADAPETAAA